MANQPEPQARADHPDQAPTPETLKLTLTRDYVASAAPSGDGALALRDGSRFRWRQFHAQGGLGVVSIAEDLELQRPVAFKQIQPKHADNSDSRRRFLLEAEITGKLEHPGIVPVYGLVADEHGQPAYAMRFIQGETLADAIREFHVGHASSLPGTLETCPTREAFTSVKFRQLLSRLVALCNTIAFAHSRGIIHRDIKPGNLMLGGYGESLVLDWGLARPFDHRTGVDPAVFAAECPLRPTLCGSGAAETQLGTAVGTPAYMAPEQAEGRWDAVGPAADIYSLGATLYALLTGKRPFDGKNHEEVLQAVRQGQFRPPRDVNPHLPKPLAAICVKAMSLEPHARYASALELAEDIEHYLADEAVAAYRENLNERARRWGRKHRALVLSASAAVLVGLVGLSLATVLLTAANARERAARRDAEDQRVRADGNLQRAKDAVEKYLTEVAEDEVLKQHDFHELRKRLLQTAVPFYEEFSKQQEHEPRRRADVGGAYSRLAHIQAELGQREEALANYGHMRDVFAALADEFPSVRAYRRQLAASHNNLGAQLRALGRRVEAEKACHRAMEIQQQLAAQFPRVPEYRQELATSHNNVGALLQELGKRAEAEKAYGRAMEIQQHLAAQFPSVRAYRQELARSHNNVGVLLRELGKCVEAEKAYRQAIEVREQLAQFRSVPVYRQTLATSHKNLGNLLSELGKHGEGEKAYGRAIEIQEQLAAQFPRVPEYRQELATSHNCLGKLLSDLGQHGGAEKAFGRAIEIKKQLAAQFASMPAYREALATSDNSLGDLLSELGRHAEAEKAYGQAIETQEQLAAQFPSEPEYRQELATSHSRLGNLLSDVGKHGEAKKAYGRAIEIREQLAAQFPTVPGYRQALATSHTNLGLRLSELGKHGEAEKAFGRAIEIQEQLAAQFASMPAYRQALATSHDRLGNLLSKLGRRAEAEKAYGQAIETQEQLAAQFPSEPEYRQELAATRNNVGVVLYLLGNRTEAVKAYRQAIEIQEQLAAQFPSVPLYRHQLARSHNNLGPLLYDLGKRAEAEKAFGRAIEIWEQLAAQFPRVPEYRQELAGSHNNVGVLLHGLGKRAEAEKAYRRAIEIKEQLAAKFQNVAEHRVDLAGSYVNFGHLVLDGGRAEQAINWYGKAITLLEPVVRGDARLVVARGFLRNAYSGRATALRRLVRDREAASDWGRAFELDDGPSRSFLRMHRAACLASVDPPKAVAEVEELVRGDKIAANDLYNAACVCSVAAANVKDQPSRDKYAARAIDFLHQAVARGYKDAQHMKQDSDLDALRQRDDYRKLVADLEAAAKKSTKN